MGRLMLLTVWIGYATVIVVSALQGNWGLLGIAIFFGGLASFVSPDDL